MRQQSSHLAPRDEPETPPIAGDFDFWEAFVFPPAFSFVLLSLPSTLQAAFGWLSPFGYLRFPPVPFGRFDGARFTLLRQIVAGG